LEQALVEAETAATLAFIWNGRSYPVDQLTSLWQTLLLHQFHDILPGSSIHSVYEAAHQQLTAALEAAAKLREDILRLSEPSDKRLGDVAKAGDGAKSASYLVWNLQLHDRPFFAEITGAGGETPLRFSIQGRPLLTQQSANRSLLLADSDARVPAMSAVALESESGTTSPPPSQDDQDQTSEPTKVWRTGARPFLTVTSRQIENQDLRITLNQDGTVESIYDKTFEREVLADRGNQLWLFTDVPRQFDAWDIDETYTDEGTELLAVAEPELIEAGPVRAALRVIRRYEDIEIVQDYCLAANSRRFDIATKVKWRGRRRLLRAIFPFAIHTHEVWSETAFGAVARPNHRNTPWDQARFEIPVHRWADLSEPGYGVSLLNNGKYGYSAHGNVLGISLLRGPIYPDPYADEGEHEFVYALFPHAGDWRNGTVREAEEMHAPLRIIPASGSGWPSLFRFTEESLKLGSLKKAEDSEAIILRLYEPHGGRGKTTIESALPLQKAAIVNILEDETRELTIDDDHRITFGFKPFQVISLKLTFKRS
jgi:alpha-mannosidase